MAYQRTTLDWTNVALSDLSEATQALVKQYVALKPQIERAVLEDAILNGAAEEGDSIKISLIKAPETIGVAIAPKAKAGQSNGWGGLKRPGSKPVSLADYQNGQDQAGYRR